MQLMILQNLHYLLQSNKERFYVRRYSQDSPHWYWWIWHACYSEYFNSKGYDVSGSDVAESAVISKFREMGATVHIGHNKEYVNGVDAVVRSTAIREDNPEIVAAKEQRDYHFTSL